MFDSPAVNGDDHMAYRFPYCEVTFSWTRGLAHRGIVYWEWEGREAVVCLSHLPLVDLKLSMSAVHIVYSEIDVG